MVELDQGALALARAVFALRRRRRSLQRALTLDTPSHFLHVYPFLASTNSMKGIQRSCRRHSMFSSWTACWFVCLCWLQAVLAAQRLGERALPELSHGQVKTLATSVDPSTNLDPDNRNAHLSKILIPRPGMSGFKPCVSCWLGEN